VVSKHVVVGTRRPPAAAHGEGRSPGRRAPRARDVHPWWRRASCPLVYDNETNGRRLWGTHGGCPFPKDGIGDHVVAGAATVNTDGTGTKGALWYRLTVEAGAQAEIRLRLGDARGDLGAGFITTLAAREMEPTSSTTTASVGSTPRPPPSPDRRWPG
jgi:hypothetical protein